MMLPCSFSTVAITLQANAITRNFLGGDEEACFQAMLCTLLLGSKWWSQVSFAVTNREMKLSEFSLNRWSRLVNALIRSCYWTSDNICGTDLAEMLFIKFSGKIKCTLPLEMPTDATTKLTDSRRSVMKIQIFCYSSHLEFFHFRVVCLP